MSATSDPPGAPGAPTGAPKRWINFDAVLPQTIEVTRGGRTLSLRDDVPMADTVRVFTLLELQDELRGRQGVTSSEMQDWYARLSAATLDLATTFIQHSHPEMARDEVATWLDFEQQMQLVLLFFQIRSQTFSTPLSALTGGSPALASSAGPAGSANRASRRRGQAGGTTRRS